MMRMHNALRAWVGAPAVLSALLLSQPVRAQSTEAAPVAAAEPASPTILKQEVPGTTVAFELVEIPSGTVEMPDPADPSKLIAVEVPALRVARTEVVWELYDIYLYSLDQPQGATNDPEAVARPSKPYVPPDRGWGHAGYPAMGITAHAAQQFCAWLSQKTGVAYRLPTSAEWQHLAQHSATEAPWSATATAQERARVAWTSENSGNTTHPVASLEPTPAGLYDTLGNVAEWVTVPGGKPIAAGGSFRDAASAAHPGARAAQAPAWNTSDPQIPKSKWWLADAPFVGFRVVCEIPQQPSAAGEGKPASPSTGATPESTPQPSRPASATTPSSAPSQPPS